MIIKKFSALTENLLEEIKEVEAACKAYDHLKGQLFLDNSINYDQNIDHLFLMYEDNRLVSILSMFIPTPYQAGVSALTLPQYRQKGCFKALLSSAIQELTKYGIPEIILICESQSESGMQAVKKINALWDFTEYYLRLDRNYSPSIQSDSRLRYYQVGIEDMDIVITINQLIFKDSYENTKSDILKTIEAIDRAQYIVALEDEIIGIYSLCFNSDAVSIYSFGILPELQGNGLGKEMLQLLLNDLLKQNIQDITIEVQSTNTNALNLYRKNGFEIEASYEYYRKTIK